MQANEEALRTHVRHAGSLLVTFSGGVDSALLAKIAFDELGSRALAMTAVGASLPVRELEDCKRIATEIGIAHIVVSSHEMADPNYRANPANRCFFCKTELYTLARRVARDHGIAHVAAGINVDDLGDHRPGIAAAREHGVLMPLVAAGLGKAEVRSLAARVGLRVAAKPAAACLASRIPYGTPVTDDRLRQIELCENLLKDLGFAECRVRHHEKVARIEVPLERVADLLQVRERVLAGFRTAGFVFVTVDLAGLRSGSMNELLAADRLRVVS